MARNADSRRQSDLAWFLAQRDALASKHAGKWLVVFDGQLRGVFEDEQRAIEHAINEYGIDVASVFQATRSDPLRYVGTSTCSQT